MIKLPSEDRIYELMNINENFMLFIKEYNAEILRLNTPERPEFDNDLKWYAKSNNQWVGFIHKPIFDYKENVWKYTKIGFSIVYENDQILWLEHINAGKEPKDSLIKLEDYK